MKSDTEHKWGTWYHLPVTMCTLNLAQNKERCKEITGKKQKFCRKF